MITPEEMISWDERKRQFNITPLKNYVDSWSQVKDILIANNCINADEIIAQNQQNPKYTNTAGATWIEWNGISILKQ